MLGRTFLLFVRVLLVPISNASSGQREAAISSWPSHYSCLAFQTGTGDDRQDTLHPVKHLNDCASSATMRHHHFRMHAGCSAAARSGGYSTRTSSTTSRALGHAISSSPDPPPSERGGEGGVFGGLQGLPRDLLDGRKTAVFWDIENVRPWTPDIGIPVLVHRIKVWPYMWGGDTDVGHCSARLH